MSSPIREAAEPSLRPTTRIRDVLRDDLRVVFVGTNPDPLSARRAHHFSHPSNAFWRLLHESGFTRRRLKPDEELLLFEEGIGVVNFSQRISSASASLSREDIERGRTALRRKLARHRPQAIVFVGITTYRMFAGVKGHIALGEQPTRIGGARVFVVPHPSGRNVHYRRDQMLEQWRSIARALGYCRHEPSRTSSPSR